MPRHAALARAGFPGPVQSENDMQKLCGTAIALETSGDEESLSRLKMMIAEM